jgi:hypothetical protein
MRISESQRSFGKDVGDSLVRGVERFEDAWVSAIETGKFEWGDFAKQILLDIARMSTRQMITGPLSSFLGGLFGGGIGGGGATGGSWGSGLWGSAIFKAGGGQARKGARIIGGENRPELFIPDENGTIVPGLPGMGNVTFQQTNYIDGSSLSPETLRSVLDAHGRHLLAAVPGVVKKAQSDGVFG